MFDAGVGIFGQQAIPTIISMLFAWPVLITQIWGLVQQSKLDDQALEIAETVIHESDSRPDSVQSKIGQKFCVGCGHPLPDGAIFCPKCGLKVQQ